MKEETALEYLKLQWADIHHSRLQEWTLIGIIAGIMYALINVEGYEGRIILAVLGAFSGFLAACISWQHNKIFLQKIGLISSLEHRIGVHYPGRTSRFSVQVLLFLLFGGICSAFIGAAVIILSESPQLGFLQSTGVYASLLSFLIFLVAAFFSDRKKGKSDTPKMINHFKGSYFIEQDKLEVCMSMLGQQPLKLVAPELYKNEVVWIEPEWKFRSENGIIQEKSLLLNERDFFQFSVANEESKQDWHYHRAVFEIYLSDHEMKLEYRDSLTSRDEKEIVVKKGALLVPPSIPHRVHLSGNTYVFQASYEGDGLSSDKVIFDPSAK